MISHSGLQLVAEAVSQLFGGLMRVVWVMLNGMGGGSCLDSERSQVSRL